MNKRNPSEHTDPRFTAPIPAPARPELASELDNLNFEFDTLEQRAHECAQLTPATPVAIREFITRARRNLIATSRQMRTIEWLIEQEKAND